MKIALVVCTFPPDIGGMGQVAYEEATRLVAAGHQVTVFTLDKGGAADTGAFSVVRLRPWLRLGDAGFVPGLTRLLAGFEVIHLHYPWYGGAEWAASAAKRYNIPLVVTYHMDAAPQGLVKRLVQKVYDVWVPKRIFRHAARVITVSKDHVETAAFFSLLDTSKLVEIANGVNTKVFHPLTSPTLPPKLQGWEGAKIVLFVGNPLPFKRLDLIIQAIAAIPDDQVRLVVVSDGYELPKYQALACDIDVEERVRFVGRAATQAELNQYYNAAHCLVVASDNAAESFALVTLEALAAGCPAIVSDIPGVRSKVVPGVDGWHFTAGSVPALAAAIEQAVAQSPTERAAFGRAGREKVARLFSWDEHVAKLIRVYTDATK